MPFSADVILCCYIILKRGMWDSSTFLCFKSRLVPYPCRELAETILDSGDTLLTILGDILDFSKIDHNSMTLEAAPVCLRTTVESTIEMVAAHAVRKGIEIAYSLDDELLRRPILGGSDPHSPGDGQSASQHSAVCVLIRTQQTQGYIAIEAYHVRSLVLYGGLTSHTTRLVRDTRVGHALSVSPICRY